MSQASHRLFFAIRPPLRLARRIANAASWFDARGQALAAERLHVTIDIIDDHADLPRGLVDTLMAAGNAVAAVPFDMAFDLAVGSPKSVALRPGRRNPGVEALRQRITAARERVGVVPRRDYRFGTHMTLGYRQGAPFTQGIAPLGWTAQEFVLIHSHVGRTRHDVLARWPLKPAPGPQLALF
ncbi:2'-5' RNA ligase family protein [uncultured Sphingomonas sp.]|uniref:2'-5' RNA ligase family protein n=1 Tax=uncultured Sphingomonas sp. TaxID=158754 RepID=UPI0035CA82F8